VIANFTPNYERVEDIAWALQFVCSQRGDAPISRAALSVNPAQETQAAMNRLSDAAADEPPNLIERARGVVRSGVDAMRVGVSSFTQGVARLNTTANVATARYQQVRSITNEIQQSARALSNGTVDLPYTELIPTDGVAEVLRVENWRITTRINTRRTAASAARGRNTIGDRAAPGVLATVTVRENQTLRQLALEYYGSADAWPTIADANGIVGSFVAPGTVLVIPRAPSSGSGTA
jgi:nucleoid-associated protein YgaU